MDCDDQNAAVHPGAAEVCNGIDDNCDGVIDTDAVDASTWYVDADGDGFGDGATSQVACVQPAGWVATGDDCNDSDPRIFPGATEVCDGVDQDCDGVIDDNVASAPNWYPDRDGDGFGDATDGGTSGCTAPPGWIADDTDCDDADNRIHPDAYDVCDDGIDSDCSGTDKDCPYSGSVNASGTAWAVFTGAAADDQAGGYQAVGIVPDMDGDGFDEVLIGACQASVTAEYAGSAYLIYGPITAGTTSLSDADATFEGVEAYDAAGITALGAGDVTGDGVPDFMVGAYYNSDAAFRAGALYVYAGGRYSGTASVDAATTTILGESEGDALGFVAVQAGDLDGDGVDDLAVSSLFAEDNGVVYLFNGPIPSGVLTAASADTLIVGDAGQERFGGGLATAGDVDDDGYDDLLVSAYEFDSNRGRAYLFTTIATVAGSTSAAGASATFDGEHQAEEAANVSGPSDLDGDGVPDVAIGAYEYGTDGFLDAYGRVYAFLSPIPGGSHSDGDADVIITGDARGDDIGYYTAAPGDVNGDGADDLLYGGFGPNGGMAVLSYGPFYAGMDLLASTTGTELYTTAGEEFGQDGVGGGGDINNDGFPDFLAAAPLASPSGMYSGEVRLFLGGP